MFDPSIKILICDDMMTMRKIVGKVCRELGYSNIVEAADGALGWQALNDSETPISLIVSDWNMPNCTGLDLLKRVRGDQRFSKIPFLLVTAEAEQGQIVEAVKAGVSGYVVKPFTSDTLKQRFEQIYKTIAKSA